MIAPGAAKWLGRMQSSARDEMIRFTTCSFFLISLACLVTSWPVFAQSEASSHVPYASMNRDAVGYYGPGRESTNDLPGNVATIGLILPLRGQRASEGKLLQQAAQIALDDETASGPLPDGLRLALAVRDESERWGQASSEMVQLIDQEHAVALITSMDGGIAHQAEQIANKIGIPILTLSSDATTTRINIPWIFRLGPSDADQARLFASDIYQRRKPGKVLLIIETGHDGRVGGEEFVRAANLFQAAPPERIEFNPSRSDTQSFTEQITAMNLDSLVLWTGPETAAKILPALAQARPATSFYLCSKAAQFSGPPEAAGSWITAETSKAIGEGYREFRERYWEQTNLEPSLAAQEIYDAVRLLAAAIRTAGANRARVRDFLATVRTFQGVTGGLSFDPAGDFTGEFTLNGLPNPPRLQAAF